MKVEYADKRLAKIKTDEAHKLGLPIAVITAARKKIHYLEQVPDELTLRNLRSLQYKKLKGEKEGRRSIRVNDQYRIEFTLDNDEHPPVIRITEIGDTH
ncbi:type II toxin-antitoxin system RelE/ParE family toxin [Qipengyuania sp.]|uniref:type II toxin-antitoxin system RelE/ParE family toxin n=1 Tax=Qipengyuania sp. TaxID=2004515 RepID=UPI003BAD6828